MYRILAILLVLLAFNRTPGQDGPVEVRHGTILLYEESSTQVIVVADSKIHADKSGKDENGCKIVNLSDDTLFFYTGNLFQAVNTRTGSEILSQQKVAHEAYSEVKTEPRSEQRLIDVANKYSELVRPEMNELFRVAYAHDFSESAGLAGFASLDEFKQPRIVLVAIPIHVSNDGAPAYTEVPYLSEPIQNKVYMGDYLEYRGVNEFLDAKTPRAKRAMDRFNSSVGKLPKTDVEVHKLIAAVQASLTWHRDIPTIGPPVDAVVIDSGTGIRWIKRKPKCSNKPSE